MTYMEAIGIPLPWCILTEGFTGGVAAVPAAAGNSY